jgi:hypothetical protein
MRKIISLLFSGVLLAATLVGLVATPASAATTLITCTDLVQNKTTVLKIDKKSCKIFSPSAMWHLQLTDSSDHSGTGFTTLRICSSKNPLFSYQFIQNACPKHQVTTNYWRAVSAPLTPDIATASARGHDSALITLTPTSATTNSDSPVAYYLVTDAKTGVTTKVLPGNLGQLYVSDLLSESTYAFTIAAVSVDGISELSQMTPSIRTSTAPVIRVVSTAPLTCAAGGTCIVGDRGPGGGIVFYVSSTSFSSPGSTCNTSGVGGTSTCKYLEVAPSTWQSAGVSVADDSSYQWSTNTTVTTGQNTVTASTEGIAAQSFYERFNWKIGQGLYNTSVMKVSGETSTAQSAVLAYAGNSTAGQWFIPSLNELNELCKYARGQVTGVPTVACTVAGTIKSTANAGTDLGGFSTDRYWSSSEGSANVAASQRLVDGLQFYDNKNLIIFVRPVRAF